MTKKKEMATYAHNLLEDPAFKSALEAVTKFYTESMVNTKHEEHEKREHLHRCIHAISDVKSALTAFIRTGKVETTMAVKREKAKK